MGIRSHIWIYRDEFTTKFESDKQIEKLTFLNYVRFEVIVLVLFTIQVIYIWFS